MGSNNRGLPPSARVVSAEVKWKALISTPASASLHVLLVQDFLLELQYHTLRGWVTHLSSGTRAMTANGFILFTCLLPQVISRMLELSRIPTSCGSYCPGFKVAGEMM